MAHMGKRKQRRNRRNRTRASRQSRSAWTDLSLETLPEVLLHPQKHDGRVWKYFIPVLVLAFAVRAALALYTDSILHVDEIFQYLEQGHRLAFGNGVVPWEHFYGVRSLMLPWLIAGTLLLFDGLGLGSPFWYIGGVKLLFCAISLLIPSGMYFFARRHFGETTGRISLVAGALWYELVGFAHKPLAELVITALLLAALALRMRPIPDKPRGEIWLAVFLLVMVTALRIQYAPVAFILLGLFFLHTKKKMQFALVTVAFVAAVGVFDAVSWNSGFFHSYTNYLRYHQAWQGLDVAHHPLYQHLIWLALASMGLGLLTVALSLRDVRRYGFLLGLILVALLVHSIPDHKEYRYIFLVVPLILMMGADVLAQFATRTSKPRWLLGSAAVIFTMVSLGGILEVLPYQSRIYLPFFGHGGWTIGFIRERLSYEASHFEAYRYLAEAPGVAGVWQVDRDYVGMPSYYYLHRKVPLYNHQAGAEIVNDNLATLQAAVSHIVVQQDIDPPSGYTLDRKFGNTRIYRREANQPPIRQWRHYTPVWGSGNAKVMVKANPDMPPFPARWGIRFADENLP